MESDITSCGICFESYNEGERKPLLLPCSHSFCQSCLRTLENTEMKACPFCNKSWGQTTVKNLPICYQLIPAGVSAQGKPRVENCSPHAKEITFWCTSCSMPICNSCLEEEHNKCKFMVIQKYRDGKGQKAYERVVNELLEKMSQNNEQLCVFKSFGKVLKRQREECLKWKSESQGRYDKFEEYCTEGSDGSANISFLQKRKEAQEAFETLNKESPIDTLLFHVARAYQKTREHRVEEFMKNLEQSVGEGRCATVSSTAHITEEEAVSTFKSGHVWTIKDTAAGLEVIRLLSTTCTRPSLLEVTGVNWVSLTLIKLLIEVSEVRCPVRMRFLDIFWNPGRNTVELTQSRLETLLKLGCRSPGCYSLDVFCVG